LTTLQRILALSVLIGLIVAPISAHAQDEETPTPEALSEADESVPAGDVLHLKSGSMMTGVQILRSTPLNYVVELVPGVEPMLIPRNQVLSVDFDDFDPVRERLKERLFPGSQEVSLASGERVSRALMDKLSAPVSAEPISYNRTDLIAVLEETAERLDVRIRLDESVKQTQPNRRRWTIEISPDTTLMAFLREELVKAFSYLVVQFENDSVIVMTKKAAEGQKPEAQE